MPADHSPMMQVVLDSKPLCILDVSYPTLLQDPNMGTYRGFHIFVKYVSPIILNLDAISLRVREIISQTLKVNRLDNNIYYTLCITPILA